jgi:hypothetical protein
MHPDAPYFSILLCLTPDDFSRQVARMLPLNGLTKQTAKCILLTL